MARLRSRALQQAWSSVRISFVSGQVAQLVERSPEKAGVGGSIPSLATTFSKTYQQPGHPGTGDIYAAFGWRSTNGDPSENGFRT
jgi:hypothetical protein